MKSIEIKAQSVEKAIENALAELNTVIENVDVEIISKGSLIKKACVKVSLKMSDGEKLCTFVQTILTNMKIDCVAELIESDESYVINIKGEDTGVAIGYRGEVLDNLQYLSLLYINNISDAKKRVVIDAENYREKREETLKTLSIRVAHKVAKSGEKHEFEPMSPYERRIIHTALQDDKFVVTKSEGEEPKRYIVIEPINGGSDNYNTSDKNDFKRYGMGKTRSFGAKQRRF